MPTTGHFHYTWVSLFKTTLRHFDFRQHLWTATIFIHIANKCNIMVTLFSRLVLINRRENTYMKKTIKVTTGKKMHTIYLNAA